MLFSRGRSEFEDPDLYLYGRRLPVVETTRFLGLVLDRRLTWLPHLQDLKAVCQRRMSLLRFLSHVSWGADRTILLRLYHSFILSKLDYGSQIYASTTSPRLCTLDPVHHGGIRLATGAFRSRPIPSLLVDAGVLPLDLHRQTQMARLWFRCQSLYGDPTYSAVTDTSQDATFTQHPHFPQLLGFRARGVLEELSLPRPAIAVPRLLHVPPWKLPAVSYCRYMPASKSAMSEHAARALFIDHASVHEGCTPIFTDGSKSDAGVGFGAVFPDFTRCGSLPPLHQFLPQSCGPF